MPQSEWMCRGMQSPGTHSAADFTVAIVPVSLDCGDYVHGLIDSSDHEAFSFANDSNPFVRFWSELDTVSNDAGTQFCACFEPQADPKCLGKDQPSRGVDGNGITHGWYDAISYGITQTIYQIFSKRVYATQNSRSVRL